MNCRAGCAACCIAISISSAIPGMPHGKAAGIRCVQLTENGLCKLFTHASRPEVCARLRPSDEMCGATSLHAFQYLAMLEEATTPS
jgi:Fe-S-cluster containining protein